MNSAAPQPAPPAWCLRTADGTPLIRLVDLIRRVADRDGLPVRAAARSVHAALQPMADVPYFAVTCEDFARPVHREWVFSWCADGSRRLIAHGFDSWCRGEGPAGIDREGLSSQLAVPAGTLSGSTAAPPTAPSTPQAPRRDDGLATLVYRAVKSAHEAGNPRPTDRALLALWRSERPPEIFKVLADGVEFYNSRGDVKHVGLKALQGRIKRAAAR